METHVYIYDYLGFQIIKILRNCFELNFFPQVLETKEFDLKPNDKEEIAKLFPEGSVSYSDFQPIAREVILRTYRVKNDSDVRTCVDMC